MAVPWSGMLTQMMIGYTQDQFTLSDCTTSVLFLVHPQPFTAPLLIEHEHMGRPNQSLCHSMRPGHSSNIIQLKFWNFFYYQTFFSFCLYSTPFLPSCLTTGNVWIIAFFMKISFIFLCCMQFTVCLSREFRPYLFIVLIRIPCKAIPSLF